MSQTQPSWADPAPVEPYPYVETHNLRTGPDLHPALLGMLPLVGVWRGRGQGGYPVEDGRGRGLSDADDVQFGSGAFHFGQEVRFSHDGRPFLAYESRSWLLGQDGKGIRQLLREFGWWRPVIVDGVATDELEAILSYPTGVQELYLGKATGTTRFELVTDAVVRTATAREVSAGHRLYGVVEGALLYAYDMAAVGQPLRSHVSARLERVSG